MLKLLFCYFNFFIYFLALSFFSPSLSLSCYTPSISLSFYTSSTSLSFISLYLSFHTPSINAFISFLFLCLSVSFLFLSPGFVAADVSMPASESSFRLSPQHSLSTTLIMFTSSAKALSASKKPHSKREANSDDILNFRMLPLTMLFYCMH